MSQSSQAHVFASLNDPFWAMVFGVFPAGKFDRYYLTFSEPHNIESSTSSNSSVNLRIDSDTVVVVILVAPITI